MDGYSLTVPAAPAEAAAVEAPTETATAETSAEAGVRKAEATKAEATKAGVEETGVSKAGVDKAKAVEPWAKEGASETAVPTAAECDGTSDRPPPAPRRAPPRLTAPRSRSASSGAIRLLSNSLFGHRCLLVPPKASNSGTREFARRGIIEVSTARSRPALAPQLCTIQGCSVTAGGYAIRLLAGSSRSFLRGGQVSP
jgi:hypothetical protein